VKICIPIIAETEEEALRKMSLPLPKHLPWEILFELRADRMRKIRMERVLREKEKRTVVTNRRREEGGGFQRTEKERVSFLLKAVDLGADYVDIEASTEPELIAEVQAAIADKGSKTLLIVSSHDFGHTPSKEALTRKLKECSAPAPDIVKIVTQANAEEDNLKILSLVSQARKTGQEIISFAMGERGRMSRVMSLFLGAYMGFASLNKGEESAPGQLSLAETVTILSILNGAPGGISNPFRGQAGMEPLHV
jgi:3-dehydroquinate dehydratase type I